MTVLEFSNEFDIAYNGIASNSAPPIDLYEKSVYLTRAQLEIVNTYYNPLGNKYKQGFEQSEKRRADLRELLRTGVSTIAIATDDGVSDDSQFFRIPNNTYLIIQEKAKISSDDECINGNYISVVPKTHDEFNIQHKNPFKEPDKNVIWRLDYYAISGNNKNVELVSPYTITEYKYRYLKYPEPIILTSLATAFPGETLSIDGISTVQTCKLGEGIHREILNRAVEMATADYKPQDIAVKTQMNIRNE
ncbi:MAG: hypothetical protein ACSLE0_23365 [Chitinophagaceae bacterium]